MSGSLTYPLLAIAQDSQKQFWGGGRITQVKTDTPTSNTPNTYGWVTGYTVGGYLNPQAMTVSNSISGVYSPSLVQNFGVDQAGNFAFQVPSAGAGNQAYTVTDTASGQSGVSSNAVVQVATPFNVTTGSILYWHDPSDPTLTLVGAPGINPPVVALLNKANPSQFLNAFGSPAPTLVRTGGVGSTRRMIACSTNPAFSAFNLGTNWFGATWNDQCGMNNVITALNRQNLGALPPVTIITAVQHNTAGGYNYAVAGGWFNVPRATAAQLQLPTTQWDQNRWSQATTQLAANGSDGTNTYACTDVTALVTNYQWFTTLYNANTVTGRFNGTQYAVVNPGNFPDNINENVFGLGINTVAGVACPPNGASFPQYGATMVFSGLLSGADLTNMEFIVHGSYI
jgi:hypothetical protein